MKIQIVCFFFFCQKIVVEVDIVALNHLAVILMILLESKEEFILIKFFCFFFGIFRLLAFR